MADTDADGTRAEFDRRDARIIGARSCMDAGADGTRAKRKQFGDYSACLPSRFIDELPTEDLEWEGREGNDPAVSKNRARETLAGLRNLLD